MRHYKTAFAVSMAFVLLGYSSFAIAGYSVTNLVSDSNALIPAKLEDPNLINPWGISFGDGATGFWFSDNNAGATTAYVLDANGNPHLDIFVGIPAPGSSPGGTPTGTVYNSNSSSFVINGFASSFIFDTEDGTIAAWRPGLTTANIAVDNSAAGAVYKGLAIATTSQGQQLYAANFNTGAINVFNSSFQPVINPSAFVDPNNPRPPAPGKVGYAPFNVQNINGKLYVTYALQDSQQHDDFSAPGNGFVDVYSTSGVLLQRLINPGGALDSPWGITTAPKSFGEFGGDLLVGNFGNSRINAFNPATGQFLGTLEDGSGSPLLLSNTTDVPGLWGLAFGDGNDGFDPNTLYFASGDNAQFDGLFGSIQPTAVPEPASLTLLGIGVMAVLRRSRRRPFPRVTV